MDKCIVNFDIHMGTLRMKAYLKFYLLGLNYTVFILFLIYIKLILCILGNLILNMSFLLIKGS
jgi:hypothetical protein